LDLNSNNFVLKKTQKEKLIYDINGIKKTIYIPKNGFETLIMDLELCEMNQFTHRFFKSLILLLSSILKMTISDNKIIQSYISKINMKIAELFEISQNDNTRNINLAIRTLEIFE
jgi:hypothetical protein